jgi:hypothetical protein
MKKELIGTDIEKTNGVDKYSIVSLIVCGKILQLKKSCRTISTRQISIKRYLKNAWSRPGKINQRNAGSINDYWISIFLKEYFQ